MNNLTGRKVLRIKYSFCGRNDREKEIQEDDNKKTDRGGVASR